MGLRARLDASEKRSLVHTGNGTNYMGTEWIELVGMKSDVFLCRRHWAVTLRKMLGPFLPDCIILTFSTCCVSWCLFVSREETSGSIFWDNFSRPNYRTRTM